VDATVSGRTPQEAALGVAVDFDPAVWLPGPTGEDPLDWVQRAYDACATDFEVEADTAESTYLHEMLTEFGTRDLACDFRFLRLRTLVDAPLIAMLSVYVDAQEDVATALRSFDPDATYYDTEPKIVEIDTARGLRRSMVFEVDGGIRPVVRYHRHVAGADTDVVLASAGAGLRAVAEGLGDLDRLAEAIWLVDAEGTRR
jgi:hypothetical protein